MVSTESDQRLLGSDIGSDHSLIKVWAMVWIWVWTMVWRWSDQNSFVLESLIRTHSVWKVWSEIISVWKVWSEIILVWKVWSEIILVWKVWSEANLGLVLNMGSNNSEWILIGQKGCTWLFCQSWLNLLWRPFKLLLLNSVLQLTRNRQVQIFHSAKKCPIAKKKLQSLILFNSCFVIWVYHFIIFSIGIWSKILFWE